MNGPRILVEGVGGIGGILSARLLAGGHDVTLVTGNEPIAAAINDRGLRVASGAGEAVIRARAYASLDDLGKGGLFDVALLVMKAHTVVDAARRTVPWLSPDDGYLVTCQNGIVEDDVMAAVGAGRVVSGIVGWGGTMHEPGLYEKTGPGEIHIGEMDGRMSDRVASLGRILECVTPVVITGNIRGALWSKLAINCIVTTPGALTGQTLGAMLAHRNLRDVALALYREVVDTAHAHGVKLERIAADPMMLYLPAGAGPLRRWAKDVVARFVGQKYGRLRSSMLQSLERGRPSEVGFINGYVVGKAKEKGMAIPLNERLVAMIEEIERKERRIEPRNIEELVSLLAPR